MQGTFIRARPYDWPHLGDLRAENLALLVIDVQRDFCAEGGYLASMGVDVSELQRIIPAVRRLRDEVRRIGGTVIYTREGHRSDLSDLPAVKLWRSRFGGAGIGTSGPMGRLLIRGEIGWNIVPELTPAAGEPIVDKPGYGAFYGTDLERILFTKQIRHLLLVGLTTDVCVHSTLREAVDRNYECLLVEDACAATESENHAAALRTAESEGGVFGCVTSMAAVLDTFNGMPCMSAHSDSTAGQQVQAAPRIS